MHLINYYPRPMVGPYEPSGEPRWSVILGLAYAGTLYVPAFAVGWGTGSREVFLMMFTGTFLFTFYASLSAMAGMARLLFRRKRRRNPAIVWLE